jgi:hypothetical protein
MVEEAIRTDEIIMVMQDGTKIVKEAKDEPQ